MIDVVLLRVELLALEVSFDNGSSRFRFRFFGLLFSESMPCDPAGRVCIWLVNDLCCFRNWVNVFMPLFMLGGGRNLDGQSGTRLRLPARSTWKGGARILPIAHGS